MMNHANNGKIEYNADINYSRYADSIKCWWPRSFNSSYCNARIYSQHWTIQVIVNLF
jgi:hypothetical protein